MNLISGLIDALFGHVVPCGPLATKRTTEPVDVIVQEGELLSDLIGRAAAVGLYDNLYHGPQQDSWPLFLARKNRLLCTIIGCSTVVASSFNQKVSEMEVQRYAFASNGLQEMGSAFELIALDMLRPDITDGLTILAPRPLLVYNGLAYYLKTAGQRTNRRLYGEWHSCVTEDDGVYWLLKNNPPQHSSRR